MGLGAPKRRHKLAHDPNNTAWAKSTTGFGHKIMSQQGWKPGDYLGAQDANHSDHYTAANASHIRVLLREENLGLGAKIGKSSAETFGLSLFSGVLGRLNGKSDLDVQKQQDALRDAELKTYQAHKYGMMNFVRGGLLVGDKMEDSPSTKLTPSKTVEGSKKRNQDEAGVTIVEVPVAKKSKRSKSGLEGLNANSDASIAEAKHQDSHSQKRGFKARQVAEPKDKDHSDGGETVSSDTERSRAKAQKRLRKEERRKRKAEKHRHQAEAASTESEMSEANSKTRDSSSPLPAALFAGNRHAVRQRYIQQKRMASMNAQAVKEIFMLKAGA